MKRALLIAGGTVGGLGAVLSVTPPQLNASSALGGLSNIAHSSNAAAVSQTTTTQPTPTPSSTPDAAGSTAAPVTPSETPTVKKKKKVVKK